MLKFIIKRLLLIIPTLLGVLLIIFTINYFIPGDPAMQALGSNYTEEAYQAKRAEMGLDKNFIVRYVDYVVGVVTRMDLGTSYDDGHAVSEKIFSSRLGITLKVGLWSCLITVVCGVALGILSAVKKYTVIDYATTTFAVIFSAAPAFWVALMAMMLFCLKVKIFPASWGTGGVRAMVLPVLCMALSPISLVARMTRTSMLDVINQDYIRTARAKGVKERTVIFSHAFRNAMVPVLTVIGSQLTMVVGGSFIIESIFTIPGIGMLLLSAINNRDFPVIQGTVLVLSFLVCIINLAVDVAYAYVDPRIKAQYEGGRIRRAKVKKDAKEAA